MLLLKRPFFQQPQYRDNSEAEKETALCITHFCSPIQWHIFWCSAISLVFQFKITIAVILGKHEVALSGFFWTVTASEFGYLRCKEPYLQKHPQIP